MIAEKVYRIPLGDLNTIRVTCERCHRTTEGDIDHMRSALKTGQCPHCGHEIIKTEHGKDNSLQELMHWIKEIQTETNVSVTFSVKE